MGHRHCFFTVDVENFSIKANRYDSHVADLILKEGLPLLLNLFAKYDIRTTFFFTGEIVEQNPQIARSVVPYGHEVACHGWTHDPDLAFDVLGLEEQIRHLAMAKKLLEDTTSLHVRSFRAPSLRVNEFTPQALLKTGFQIDSSVSPQRFDMFLSFGQLKKLKWIFSPRMPYQTSMHNLAKRGNYPIVEIPLSSFFFPYIGTSLRVWPSLTRVTRSILELESRITNKPINFLFHPNECIEESKPEKKYYHRAHNFFSLILADFLRSRLKQRNLGKSALTLLEQEIVFFKKRGYQFIPLIEFFEQKKLEIKK